MGPECFERPGIPDIVRALPSRVSQPRSRLPVAGCCWERDYLQSPRPLWRRLGMGGNPLKTEWQQERPTLDILKDFQALRSLTH